MELKKWIGKGSPFLKRYRYFLLVLLIGIALMLLPVGSEKTESTPENAYADDPDYIATTTQQLSDLLSSMQGVGNVRVMLTVARGEQVIYQTDDTVDTSENSSSVRKVTVIVTGTDREETGLVSYINPPEFLGAIIVCQGADDASVRLSVVEAVSKITGLSSDKIAVVKMK